MIANQSLTKAGFLLLVLSLFFVFSTGETEAATYTVDKFGESDASEKKYTNITQAVDAASAGDTIRVASRTYFDAIEVDKRLTLIGGNYGSDLGTLYDCENGDLVAKYYMDHENPSEIDDGVWCDELNGDVEGASTLGGVWENGLDFDGSNDYVEIDDDSEFNTQVVSVSSWINIDDNDTDLRTIFSSYEQTDSSRSGYKVTVNDNAKFEFTFGFGSSSGSCQTTKTISENTWTHLVATYDKSSIKLYVNGELDNSCNYDDAMSSNDGKKVIGASDYNGDGTYDDFFDGTLDDITI